MTVESEKLAAVRDYLGRIELSWPNFDSHHRRPGWALGKLC